MRTPVAFFAYNRPEHSRRALEALARCRAVETCDFHFFADGARNEAARESVEATRRVLREWVSRFGARLTERDANLGLANSIAGSVSDLCARYGRVVVVEDDLVVSPDFLHYMLQSLDRYQDDERVMQVGGCTLSPPATPNADVFLLPVTTTWGWATWQRAWKNFSWTPEGLAAAKTDSAWNTLFNLHGAVDFSAMLDTRMAGGNDSWGILWWYAVSRRRGLVAYPARSLVWNGGFDGSGVHCGTGDGLGQADPSTHGMVRLPDALLFPEDTDFAQAHLDQLEDFLRSMSGTPTGGLQQRAPVRRLWAAAQGVKARLRRAFR